MARYHRNRWHGITEIGGTVWSVLCILEIEDFFRNHKWVYYQKRYFHNYDFHNIVDLNVAKVMNDYEIKTDRKIDQYSFTPRRKGGRGEIHSTLMFENINVLRDSILDWEEYDMQNVYSSEKLDSINHLLEYWAQSVMTSDSLKASLNSITRKNLKNLKIIGENISRFVRANATRMDNISYYKMRDAASVILKNSVENFDVELLEYENIAQELYTINKELIKELN